MVDGRSAAIAKLTVGAILTGISELSGFGLWWCFSVEFSFGFFGVVWDVGCSFELSDDVDP